MSRPLDAGKFGLIYAGAQKNIGPAGVCMVIVRNDMLDIVPESIPTMLSYKTYVSKNSLFNTPPCFAIYTVQLIMKWLEETIGGLENMEALNQKKSRHLYDFMDAGDFYNEELEKQFVRDALDQGLGGLKGHRSVGGCRASIYNATTIDAVESLVDFMKYFETRNG
jgi:phosphoserine aminotransferase